MKNKSLVIGCFFLCFLIFAGCTQKNDLNNETKNNKSSQDIIVSVNGELVLKSEIDPVYAQYVDTNVTYEKIVEDTIKEILVIQQASKYNIEINDKEIEQLMIDFEKEQPKLYLESLELYGESTLKRKLKDTFLYDQTKIYVKEHIVILNDKMITSFKNQEEFDGYLDSLTNEEILKSLESELREYAFYQWIEELRSESEIIYYNK